MIIVEAPIPDHDTIGNLSSIRILTKLELMVP